MTYIVLRQITAAYSILIPQAMKNYLLTLFHALLCVVLSAQGNLQFSQALIVSNTVQTVPTGKVWKITALSGTASSVCVPHPEGIGSIWYQAISVSGFELNGTRVYSMLKYPTSGQRFNSNTCVTPGFCCDNQLTAYNQNTDPLVLPMWLPEGYTLKSLGANIFLSVLEFTIVP
jgi:hypothetical protein